jgi:hypothetical protein
MRSFRRAPAVIARSAATKQSTLSFFLAARWIASRSPSSGGALRRPVGSQRRCFKYACAFPRRDTPEPCQNSSPHKTEGVGNAGCQAHPQPRVRILVVSMHTSIHSEVAKVIRHPHAMVYGLFRALPGDRALLPPSLAESSSTNLTPASRRQDHTSWPSASVPFVIGT